MEHTHFLFTTSKQIYPSRYITCFALQVISECCNYATEVEITFMVRSNRVPSYPDRNRTGFSLCQASGLTNEGDWGAVLHGTIQYNPRNMHTVFALLCFVVVIHWLIFPYPSSLLHWHCANLMIAPVPAKQPWWIWINTSCEFIMNDCITTTKQSTTKPCAYFLGYTVCMVRWIRLSMRQLRLHSYGFSYSVD